MNDPEEDGCADQGDGEPGACPLGKTVDERSLKDGYAAEAIVYGDACGKNFLVTVSEKNSVGFLYDVTDISNPKLAQVFHLSLASETKNPVVAYEDRSLGEIDAESIIFFDEDESPSGKAAVLFAGAFSTTTSYWEFDCGAASSELWADGRRVRTKLWSFNTRDKVQPKLWFLRETTFDGSCCHSCSLFHIDVMNSFVTLSPNFVV